MVIGVRQCPKWVPQVADLTRHTLYWKLDLVLQTYLEHAVTVGTPACRFLQHGTARNLNQTEKYDFLNTV